MMGLRDPLRPRNYKPWHGYLVAGVIVIALVMSGVQNLRAWLSEKNVPTADVPEVTYEEVVEEVEGGQERSGEIGEENDDEPTQETSPDPTPTSPDPRVSYNLALPWLSQAPFGVWDAMHEETCEEASFEMVVRYYEGVVGDIDPADGDAELFNLVSYEGEHGYDLSLTAAEATEVIEGF
ncbi:MAG: hypothetical protein NUV56_04960, partial [Candidatus Uhrbacteria bacterium]|nr:hypothetical protein [Candidatus Uhrbacteria bacterium]